MKQTFEEFLQDKHMEDYHGTDDDAPDAYEAWVSNLDIQEVIDYAEKFGEEQYESGHIKGELKNSEPTIIPKLIKSLEEFSQQ